MARRSPGDASRSKVIPLTKSPGASSKSPGPTSKTSKRKSKIPEEYFKAKEQLLEKIGGIAACINARLNRRDDEVAQAGLENIRGIYIGYKKRDGHDTGELAVIVQVRRKVTDTGRIAPEALLPKWIEIGGAKIPVDVETVGSIYAHAVFGAKQNPARPGTSISTDAGLTGTLGCLCWVETINIGSYIPCILSNAHVLAYDANNQPLTKARRDDQPENPDTDASRILHPGLADLASGGKSIALLYDFLPLSLSNVQSTSITISEADAALGWAGDFRDSGSLVGAEFNGNVQLEQPNDDDLSEPAGNLMHRTVIKVGRTTGRRTGTVIGVDGDPVVGYGQHGPPFAHVRHALIIQGVGDRFSDHGDSGSLVLDAETNKPVALLYGGEDEHQYTFATPIATVMESLRIRKFATPDDLGPP